MIKKFALPLLMVVLIIIIVRSGESTRQRNADTNTCECGSETQKDLTMADQPCQIVTAVFNGLIQDEDLAKIRLPARVIKARVGAQADKQFHGGELVVKESEQLLTALQNHRLIVEGMNQALKKHGANKDIDLPDSKDYGVYALTFADTPSAIDATKMVLTLLNSNGISYYKGCNFIPNEPGKSQGQPAARFLPTGAGQHSYRPDRGELYIQQLETGYRYALNYVYWDDWDSLSYFSNYPNGTLEIETVLNNYDRKTYLGRYNNAGWSFPRGYKDTQLSDRGNERNWTIGCASASELQPETWYYCWIVTTNGNSDNDTGKLQVQAGHRSPSWCYNTWCIFADETAPIYPAWRLNVPLGIRWWYG